MELRILGPLEAAGVQLSGGKQKALLALLLLHPGRVVPMAQLVDDLWGDEAPDSAQKMVQISVSQLRKQLPDGLLRTKAPGYLVDLSGHALDLTTFTELAQRGREALAENRPAEATELLGAALALWRGPALAEFSEPFARHEADRLEEQHLACLEDRIDAELALGRHADIVGDLDALVGRQPHRERPRAQLMLALYRSGRQAEALAAYQSFRRLLRDDLGIDPSSRLRELERRMLQQDPELDAAAAPAPVAAPAPAPAPAAEMLKLVTVLFADVVGSTARAETMHPEDVRALMTDFFTAMSQELRAEGATIEKFAGDAIMAVFGVPTAREDDAVRAVRAARRMLERLAHWNLGRDQQLEIRIGLNTGEVIASSEPDGQMLVAGDAVNVASRLQRAAEGGTILVGARTARAARSHFAFDELAAPLDVKGKAAPVEAWLVTSERETAERALPGLTAALVGRTHELGFLRTALERVRAEETTALVTLLGDAGIGKSRLAAEFCDSFDGEVKVLVGRCLPSGQGAPLAPFAEILKAEAGVFETDSASAASTKVEHVVRAAIDADLAPDRGRAEAALESTLGLRRTDDPLGSLDPRDRFREVVAAWRALVASLARRSPVVVVVEDLHWADPTLLELLDELADGLQGPVLFLCTARPDLLRTRPDWGGGRRTFASLPLEPLSTEDSGLLISLLVDVESLTDAARSRILARSEGNPFFLEEILRQLIDEGLVVHDDGRWRARERIEEVELPDSVQAVILARLDLLTPEERRVAQRAAVVGRRFWDGALAAIGSADDLDAMLRTLRRREFVVERVSSTFAGEREFVFKHVLVRDVAYESLPRAERGRAHVESAEWIERRTRDRSGRAEMLAHHYDAAFGYLRSDELRLKAREHLLDASTEAHRRFAVDEGERFARRAVELSESGAERLVALEALADLHYLSGDAAWRAYTDALSELAADDPAYARIAGKAAEFACRWVGTMQVLPPVEDVNRVIDAGLAAAAPASAERALLLVDRAYLMVQREGRRDEATRAALEDAVAAAETLGDPDLLSAGLDVRQAEQMHSGRYGEMFRTALQRLELVPRLTDAREVVDAFAMASWSAQYLGRFREAEQHATACIERARSVDAGSYLHGLTWRVGARFQLGDWDGALADQTEIERVAEGEQRDVPASFSMHAYACAGLCHERRGDTPRADAYLATAFRYLERRSAGAPGPLHATPQVALILARRARFDQAVDVLQVERRTGGAGAKLAALCEIVAERGAWDEAADVVAQARDEAAACELEALPAHADRLEGRAAAAAGDAARAAGLLRRSVETFHALEARWEEAWSRLLLGEVLAADDRVAAERERTAALAVFDELGSVREAERARTPLVAV